VLKCIRMTDLPGRIRSLLAGAWTGLGRAFTSSRVPDAAPGFESDTTLFGGLAGQPHTGESGRPDRQDFWDAGGESSYFADAEPTDRKERR
jgi:hypothetical protein